MSSCQSMYLPVARQDSADRCGGVLVNNMDNTCTVNGNRYCFYCNPTSVLFETHYMYSPALSSQLLCPTLHPEQVSVVTSQSCPSSPEFDNLQSTTLLPTQLPLLAYYLHTAASQPGQLTLSFGCGDVVFIIFILFVRYLDN